MVATIYMSLLAAMCRITIPCFVSNLRCAALFSRVSGNYLKKEKRILILIRTRITFK